MVPMQLLKPFGVPINMVPKRSRDFQESSKNFLRLIEKSPGGKPFKDFAIVLIFFLSFIAKSATTCARAIKLLNLQRSEIPCALFLWLLLYVL